MEKKWRYQPGGRKTKEKERKRGEEQGDILEQLATTREDERGEAAPELVSRMSGWQFRGADPVSHGVRLVFH